MKVAIGIATFKRPIMLDKLLKSIFSLKFENINSKINISIIVVDNDKEKSAENVIKKIKNTSFFNLYYFAENKRGLSTVRNRIIKEYLNLDADFLAFVDDDEVVTESWLENLLLMQAETDADVVTGPLYPLYNENTPEWILKLKYFEPAKIKNKQILKLAFTNNCLIRKNVFLKMSNYFDEKYNFSGREDIDFFTRVYLEGFLIVYSKDSVVKEWIPVNRMKLKWMLSRKYRYMSDFLYLNLKYYPSFRFFIYWFFVGSARVFLAILFLPFSFLGGRILIARTLFMMFKGFATLALFKIKLLDNIYINRDEN